MSPLKSVHPNSLLVSMSKMEGEHQSQKKYHRSPCKIDVGKPLQVTTVFSKKL